MHARTHTHTHTYAHTHTHTHARTHTHTHTYTHMHAHTHARHKHTHAHTYIHTRMHTRTQAYRHTGTYGSILKIAGQNHIDTLQYEASSRVASLVGHVLLAYLTLLSLRKIWCKTLVLSCFFSGL